MHATRIKRQAKKGEPTNTIVSVITSEKGFNDDFSWQGHGIAFFHHHNVTLADSFTTAEKTSKRKDIIALCHLQ